MAQRPVFVIVTSLAFTFLCGLGLINFHWESNAIKLWIPKTSDFAYNYDYLWNKYPPDMRFHSIVFTTDTGENILQPKYLQQVS